MERYLINYISQWQFICLLSITISLVVIMLTNLIRSVTKDIAHSNPQRRFIYSVVAIISNYYTVLMAFVVIALWQAFTRATLTINNEADYLSVIVRNSHMFSAEFATLLQQTIGDYIKNLIQYEWETMKWGQESQFASAALDKIVLTIQSYTPNGEKERFYYENILNNLSSVVKSRRERVAAFESVLPNPLRVIMYAGAIMIPCFLAIIEMKEKIFQQVVIVAVSTVLGFNLGFATHLDYPFSGLYPISYEPFTRGELKQFHVK